MQKSLNMHRLLFIAAVLSLSGLANSFELLTDKIFYTQNTEAINLICGKSVWNKDNPVTFYKDNDELFFNSASKDKFPFVASTKDNHTITLNSKNVKGWKNLYCIADSIISDNTMNIPQVDVPLFQHTPPDFKLGENIRIGCDGAVYPDDVTDVAYKFMFEKYTICTIRKGIVTGGNAPGIRVILGSQTKDTIKITPTLESNYGKYYCALDFKASAAERLNVTSSNSWITVKPKAEAKMEAKPADEAIMRKVRSIREIQKDSFVLNVSRSYYSPEFPEVKLACNASSWKDEDHKVIVFYTGKTVIFDSSSNKNFPMVDTTSNRTILLRDNYTTGWKDLSCTINDKRSSNTVTIPFLVGPGLAHSPETFKYGETYTLGCNGKVLPAVPTTIKFLLEKQILAVITNGRLNKGTIRDVEIEDTIVGNNAIKFKPTGKGSIGHYTCVLQFTMENSDVHAVHSYNTWFGFPETPNHSPGSSAFSIMVTNLLTVVGSFIAMIINSY